MAYNPVTGKWEPDEKNPTMSAARKASAQQEAQSQALSAKTQQPQPPQLKSAVSSTQPTNQPQPVEQNESVSKRITGLLSSNSPYMQTATAEGNRQANRRGLLNSSIAVGAVQNERIKAALPIAIQEAGQAHQTNLQSRDITSRERMQGRDITSQEGMQLRDIASREGMQEAQLSQLNESQIRDIASREGMQAAELANLIQRQATDIESRERMQGLDIESQQRIANLNVSSAERQQASALAASFETAYSNILSSIMSNPDIPASARQRYMNHVSRMRDNNLALVEQLFNIELNWAA